MLVGRISQRLVVDSSSLVGQKEGKLEVSYLDFPHAHLNG